MSQGQWSNLPYLESLRPEPGWRTRWCVLTSYSTDLVALVAAILAAAGVDDDRGSGSKVDFVNAFDHLKGRLRLIVQAGRLVAPPKTSKATPLLDQFVHEVSSDEKTSSWHPKIALSRLESDDGAAVQWRLWTGSRNLTRDLSWDVGLSLIACTGEEGRPVDGVAELGEQLCELAALPGVAPSAVRSELEEARWQCPDGCDIEELRLHRLGTTRSLPAPPQGLERLTVISPFLDGTVADQFGGWGEAGTQRVLLSTRPELRKLATQCGEPLSRFDHLLTLEAPDLEPEDSGASEVEDEEPEPRSLHAKMLLASGEHGHTLWLGSANATQRGWLGPNAEVTVKLNVSDRIANALKSFVDERASTIDPQALEHELDEVDVVEERLEEARKQVAARWDVVLRHEAGTARLEAELSPHPDDTEVTLEVGLLGTSPTLWPHNAPACELAPIDAGAMTELIHCKLTLEEQSCRWLQLARAQPALTDERDRQAMARYLDPRTFLQWIRGLLSGAPVGDGGGNWDIDESTPPPVPGERPEWSAPTLEEVLKAWSQDPGKLWAVDRTVSRYMALMTQQPRDEDEEQDLEALRTFERTWKVLRAELIDATP